MDKFGLRLPCGEVHLQNHELRRLLSLARTGLQASKERGIMTDTDKHLEQVLNSNRVKF